MACSSNKHGHRGMAMVLVVFAIAMLAALTVALLDQATIDLGILRNHTSGLRALYAAQAGLAKAIETVRLNYNASGYLSGTLTTPDGRSCTYEATIDNAKPRVTVTATGRADGFVRKVRAHLVVSGPPMVSPYPVRVLWWKEVTASS